MHRAYQPYYLYFHALGSSIDTSPVDDDVTLQDLVQHQPSPRNSSPTTINDPVSANEEAVAVPKKKKKPATANQLQRGALAMEQEIQQKRLEVVQQELLNAQHLGALQAKQEILTDLKIQKLTHELQILRGEIGDDVHYMVEEVNRV